MDILEELAKYKRIIVYGAGKVGKTVVRKIITSCPDLMLEYVAVTSYENNPYHIFGRPVICIGELANNIADKSECAVLIATLEAVHEEIRQTLLGYGFDHQYFVSDKLYANWREERAQQIEQKMSSSFRYSHMFLEPCANIAVRICEDNQLDKRQTREYVQQIARIQYSGKPVIPRLVVVLGTKCSLHCKECNNLIPHFIPQFDLDLNSILSSLEIILEKAEAILCCELIGGEPFLSRNLEKSLQFLLDKRKVGQVEITTNGTVMPKAAIIPLLKDKKVKVCISDYGVIVDKQRIIGFLKENNIYYQVLNSARWISPGGTEKRYRKQEQLMKCYNKCASSYYCKTLYGSRIFSCARAASLYALGYMKEDEYISVNENTTFQEVKNFWLKEYSEACDYCDTGIENIKFVKPGEQV